ncbi:hypothetical protein LGH83_12090 [Lichenihabitans sp. PAMC28606]|uniref:hypothetical protein n=1 Tax=Lichenihabitans sp. PAMC28606 TaxID=2880932 RepID=UPI001D0AAAD1|nr:hypothetical protein [Lichenihabitans sp. PAMC28606]UDL93327.1 hypothetical protein LGH83_12090 [Lichenihabitans sp. PAMC28606]
MILFETTQKSQVWLNPLDVTSIEHVHTGSVVTMNNGSKFFLVLEPSVVADQIHLAFGDDDMADDEMSDPVTPSAS